jgi:hypothetical protein
MKQFESSFNPDASKIIADSEQGRDILLDHLTILLTKISGEWQSKRTLMIWDVYQQDGC